MLSQVVWLSAKMQQGTPESFMLFLILEYLHHLVWSERQSSSEWPLHPSSPRGPGWCQPLRCGRWAPVPRGHLGAAPGTKHNRVSINWTPLCIKHFYYPSYLYFLSFPFLTLPTATLPPNTYLLLLVHVPVYHFRKSASCNTSTLEQHTLYLVKS